MKYLTLIVLTSALIIVLTRTSLLLSLLISLSHSLVHFLSRSLSLSPQKFNQTVHTAMKQMSVKMKFTFYAPVDQTKLFVLPCVIMMMSGTLKLDNVCYKQHCILLPLVRTASRTSKKRGRASHIQSSPVISSPFHLPPAISSTVAAKRNSLNIIPRYRT